MNSALNTTMNFSNPESIVASVGIGEAATVVDLGAGSGFYSIAAAHAVGQDGHVYAVDIQKELLGKITEMARFEGISTIETLWGNIEQLGGSKVGSAIADVVMICNTLFQIEDRDGLVSEVKRIMRPSGRLLIVDWTDYHGGVGPDMQHIIGPEVAEKLFTDAGFVKEKDLIAGDHHYGFVMRFVQ